MHFEYLRRRRALVSQKRQKPGFTNAVPEDDWRERAERTPGVRLDKVRAICEALEAGTYDVNGRVQSLMEKFEQGQPPKTG